MCVAAGKDYKATNSPVASIWSESTEKFSVSFLTSQVREAKRTLLYILKLMMSRMVSLRSVVRV